MTRIKRWDHSEQSDVTSLLPGPCTLKLVARCHGYEKEGEGRHVEFDDWLLVFRIHKPGTRRDQDSWTGMPLHNSLSEKALAAVVGAKVVQHAKAEIEARAVRGSKWRDAKEEFTVDDPALD